MKNIGKKSFLKILPDAIVLSETAFSSRNLKIEELMKLDFISTDYGKDYALFLEAQDNQIKIEYKKVKNEEKESKKGEKIAKKIRKSYSNQKNNIKFKKSINGTEFTFNQVFGEFNISLERSIFYVTKKGLLALEHGYK